MDAKEFLRYAPIVEAGPFKLWPAPEGIERNEFIYLDHTQTHVRIENVASGRKFYLPLDLVEFASPGETRGVLRLKRRVEATDGSLV